MKNTKNINFPVNKTIKFKLQNYNKEGQDEIHEIFKEELYLHEKKKIICPALNEVHRGLYR